jgi:acyl CoA:acetate/3-ketoacid CoA transferase
VALATLFIARRCAFELPVGGVVNLGIGMHGPSRRRRPRQRTPVRTAAGRRRRLHQHQPESWRVLFGGKFTTGGLEVKVENGELKILCEGKSKSSSTGEQIPFNGAHAAESGQPVLYVTERRAFRTRTWSACDRTLSKSRH